MQHHFFVTHKQLLYRSIKVFRVFRKKLFFGHRESNEIRLCGILHSCVVKIQKIIIGQNLICNNVDSVLHDSNSLSKIHAKLKKCKANKSIFPISILMAFYFGIELK